MPAETPQPLPPASRRPSWGPLGFLPDSEPRALHAAGLLWLDIPGARPSGPEHVVRPAVRADPARPGLGLLVSKMGAVTFP